VVASAQSGIARFDAAEREGLAAVFGEGPVAIPVALPKRIFGETFGASGAFACASALAWFGGVPVQPLATGTSEPAPQRVPEHVLVVAVGYYGNASALVLRRPR
jgi:3-oxoacyl-(acyl-carrier-protein) synthase